MNLLIVTQKVDEKDSLLGFMHGWIREFSLSCDKMTVICLEKGDYHLPENVKVFSLGKEDIKNFQFPRLLTPGTGGQAISNFQFWRKIKYLWNFYKLILQERKNYDAVFVHMNEEYVLFGGVIWKCWLKKSLFMWRNHYTGSWKTKLAGLMCDKVFCTSKSSYTANFKNAVLMPVGVDTEFFKSVRGVRREPRSILFYARMSPSKRPDVLLKALAELIKKGVKLTARFYGNSPQGQDFYDELKKMVPELGLYPSVALSQGLPYVKGPETFSAYEIFVNLSPAGMYDKTLFEASGCGCLVLATSPDFAELVKDDRFCVDNLDPKAVADKLEKILNLSESEKTELSKKFQQIALTQSFKNLSQKIFQEMQK